MSNKLNHLCAFIISTLRHAKSSLPYIVVFLSYFALSFVISSLSSIPYSISAETAGAGIDVEVATILALATDTNSLNLDITPSSGDTTTGDITITASTNNFTGYYVTMSAKQAENVNLVHADDMSIITNTTHTLTPDTLSSNTWGYSLAKTALTDPPPTTFLSIPAPATPDHILTTDKTGTDSAILTIGVTADNTIPAGTYSSTITFTIIANEPPPPPEIFSFIIDTRMTNTLDTNPTHLDGIATTFYIPTSGMVGGASNHNYDWIVNCGDNQSDQIVSGTSSVNAPGANGVACNYATPGEYQITIKPNGIAFDGWMNAFGFADSSAGANALSNQLMFKSVASPFTNLMRSSTSTHRFAYIFHYTRNASSLPSYTFKHVKANAATDTSFMFYESFYQYAYNTTDATIPAGLFDSITPSNSLNTTSMFHSTFRQYAYNSTVANIPASLFDALDTRNATNLASMFDYTFNSTGWSSLVATIPADLFKSVTTTQAENLSCLFCGTFYLYARSSMVATIPAGLFDSIDTSNATNLATMFSNTFSVYAYLSPIATIPSGLFSTIDTSNATNLTRMYYCTFDSYAPTSNVGTVPSNLLDRVSLANASSFDNMFYNTFTNYATTNTTNLSDINAIWGNANFASKITSANAAGVFTRTFQDLISLTGSAQTFINTKLGTNLIPTSSAATFRNTGVTDLSSLDANWK